MATWKDSIFFNINKELIMSKKNKKKPANNAADQKNPNKGTKGTNIAWDKAQGNRGQQISNNKAKKN